MVPIGSYILPLIHLLGYSPLDFLFNTVTLPTLSQPATDYNSPLRKYQNSLRQQLLGRTIALDSVLDTLEQCARHVYEDTSLIRAGSRYEFSLGVTFC